MAGGRYRSRIAGAVFVAVVVGACGGEEQVADPRRLEAGQVDIILPEGFTVENGTVVAPAATPAPTPATAGADEDPAGDGATGEQAAADPVADTVAPGVPADPVTTDSTIPLNDTSDPTTDFFQAFTDFRSCLGDEGVTFIGVPDGADPNSPTNDPVYIEALSLCAARSNILEAIQAAQSAQQDQTPEEIEEANVQYLAWRECMIDRGWGIPEPVPDADGRLFSLGGQQQTGGAQFEPPPGKDLFTSDDITECAAEVGRASQEG